MIEGLVLETPPNMKYLAADVDVISAASDAQRVVLGALSGQASIRFSRAED